MIKKLYNNKLVIMENQGKSKNQMRASYIGAFVGFVGIFVMLLYAMFN